MGTRTAFRAVCIALLSACFASVAGPTLTAPDPDGAAMIFAEAKAICARDHAALWGRELCGPILLVDPMDRAVIANQADADGVLKAAGANFAGVLPDAIIVANTPTQWSGVRWTQLTWPMTFETMNRHVTLAHEMFHRIQPALGLIRPEADNKHLDTLDGRYLLQLEWRALARALSAITSAERNAAIADALLFRQERYRRFAGAATDEAALETNEGVPEYTGVRLGLATPQERIAYAVYDLSFFVEAPSFVRSFAYATGPAYGLLLDQADPDWKAKLGFGRRLDELLAGALSVQAAAPALLAEREAAYDDGSLRAHEEQREADRRVRLARFKARLVDGPVLSAPLVHANYRFSPQALTPLEGFGTIYPTMQVSDEWGVLDVDGGGALVPGDKSKVSVSATGISSSHFAGAGWRLTLKTGWTVRAGPRGGDFEVVRAAP